MRKENQIMKQDVQAFANNSVIATTGAAITGFTLNEWVGIATLAFIIYQAILMGRKHYLFEKDRRDGKKP